MQKYSAPLSIYLSKILRRITMSKFNPIKYSNELYKKHRTFSTKNNNAYIEIPGNKKGSHIDARIGDREFDDFLEIDSVNKFKEAITPGRKGACIRYLTAKVRELSKIRETHNRVAMIDNAIYIDSGNDARTIKITAKGVKRPKRSKPKFIQSNLKIPFPDPDNENASLDAFLELVNIKNKHDIQLVITWMLFSFFTGVSKPVLIIQGSKGCAKSYTQSTIKKIIDPSSSLLRTPPRASDDVVIAATNSHVLSYNNVSKLSQAMQDDMCLISTGGTYASRKKFTDLNEVTSDIRRPMMMNGITNFITADDLQQRCIFIHCGEISPSDRKIEQELNEIYEQNKSEIFGWIVNSLIEVMKHMHSTEMPNQLDRMADFYYFGHVVEKALGRKKGSFARAFKANQTAHAKYRLKASPVALAIIELKHSELLPFTGTMKELLHTLQKIDPFIMMEARKLSADLKEIHEPILEAHNIKIGETTRSGPGNKLTISCVE